MKKACKSNNWHYNPNLLERAKWMRKHATKAEVYLWKFALKSKIMGFKFERQRPVFHYIPDFLCKELMLIIECDGITHQLEGAEQKDLKRQRTLETLGFTFLRFEDGMILNHLGTAQQIIEQEINRIVQKNPSLASPSPPRENISK
jgi:very-short-patch-repair endonuclease